MKVGVLSDVHGNRVALEAVVADGHSLGVDTWWALGDLVAIGPEPAATLELLCSLPNLSVTTGNTERYVLTGDRPFPQEDDVRADPDLLDLFASVGRSFAWTCGALAASGWLPWLRALPGEVRGTLPDGTRVLGVHASPHRDDGAGISPDRPEQELQQELDGAGADVVIAGHTDRPTDRFVGTIRAVNGGSVSNPITDDLRASFVVVYADAGGYRIEHRRVAYDRDEFLRRVAASGHPAHDYIASFQRGEQSRFGDELRRIGRSPP
ncbi:MAG: metallophosphoesterase family protein [Actinomycetota bacterium]